MSRRKILLTGPSGTLGRNILELVGQDSGHQILALLRGPSRFQNRFSSVQEVRADLSDRRKIAEIVSEFRPEIIVHCAATGMEFPKTEWFDLIRFNVDFTVNLCECAAGAGAAHFIFIGTGLAYRPQSRPLVEEDAMDTPHPYGASKAAADLLIRSAAVEFGLPLTVLRPFSFTGLGDDRSRLFPSLLRAAAAGQAFDLTPGRQVRDHVSARDVAWGILAAIQHPPSADLPAIFNLGSGMSLPVRTLVEQVVAELGLRVRLHFGAKPAGPFEPEHLVADISRAERVLGWRPRHGLAHAVWELAKESFPDLSLREPGKSPS
jgi:nucleoside-diphosphate-sugar epimerase